MHIIATALCKVMKFTFIDDKMEQPLCKQPCKELMKMISGLNNLFSLIFLTLIKIIETSLTIQGFPWHFVEMAYTPGFPGSV